jgi:hypothetical protein
MRNRIVYLLLLGVKALSRAFYRFNVRWVGDAPLDPWAGLRLVLLLNHTSLYEPLFAGLLPNGFLKRIARDGLVPVADVTYQRPLVGRFFRTVAGHVVPVTRRRDRSWDRFLEKIEPESLVIMAPEGRMMRADGLDCRGAPMTVRGGVADMLLTMPAGRMLLAYSGGLHHVQVPSQLMPRMFKTLQMTLETMDIARYRRALLGRFGMQGFKAGVIRDLEARRDAHRLP